jgi:hypothetical protein
MFSLNHKASHDLSEMPKFIVAQSPLAALNSELSNALRRILADDVQPGRVAEKSAQRSDRSARNSRAASRLAASSCLAASRRLAGGDVRLHRLDVAKGETADEPRAQQGFDVSLNTASIHLQGRRLDRAPIAPEDPASFRFLQIPIAHLIDRHARSNRVPLGGGIFTLGDAGELFAGEVAGVLRR